MLKILDDCNRITWATSIRNLLCRYGFWHVWIAQRFGVIDNFNLLQEYGTLMKMSPAKLITIKNLNVSLNLKITCRWISPQNLFIHCQNLDVPRINL